MLCIVHNLMNSACVSHDKCIVVILQYLTIQSCKFYMLYFWCYMLLVFVAVYDVLTGKIVTKLQHHQACVRDVSWHPYENSLVSSSVRVSRDGYLLQEVRCLLATYMAMHCMSADVCNLIENCWAK